MRRLIGAAVVLLAVSVIAFSLGSLARGDPAQIILLRRTGEAPPAAAVIALRHEMGLDRPALDRYARWLANAMRGELGNSYRTGMPVLDDLRSHFLATLTLAMSALVLSTAIAFPLALLSVASRNSALDHGLRIAGLAGISIPGYLIAYLLILLFAVRLGALPVSGSGGLRHLVLPALTLAVGSSASLTRLLRATLLNELGDDYVRTARAKGVSTWRVLSVHALRNSLNPVITVSALRAGRLLGEAAIVETIFAWPGIGLWIVSSIYDRDYPAIQGFVLYIATVFVSLNVLVDVLYRGLDPRVRLGAPTPASA